MSPDDEETYPDKFGARMLALALIFCIAFWIVVALVVKRFIGV